MPSGFVGGVLERAGVWGGRKSPTCWIESSGGPPWWSGGHSSGHLRGELGLFRLGRESSEGMSSSTAGGYREDRARLSSGTRGNGHKLQQSDVRRTLLRESGQTLEPVPRKLMGSPALEIQNSSGRGHEQPSPTLNLALSAAGGWDQTISRSAFQPT